MFKVFSIFIFSFITFCDLTKSNNIECNYEYKSYTILQNIFHCNVINDPQITTKESAEVTLTNSRGSEINDEIIGFYIYKKNVQYFPKGLEKIFKNLKAITISISKLKEVTQLDLKPFPKLVYLEFYLNSLVFIEPGLFDFNPDLQFISFLSNKIIHVDLNVFDNLSHLTHLWLRRVLCIKKSGLNRQMSLEIINKLKNNCKDKDFEALERKFKEFEEQVNGSNLEDFQVKMKNFEDDVMNMKFSESSYFKRRIEALKTSQRSPSSSSKSPVNIFSESTTEPQKTSKHSNLNAQNFCKFTEKSDLSVKINNLTLALNDLESLQTDYKDNLEEIKMFIDSQDLKLSALQNSQNKLHASTLDTLQTQKSLQSTQDELKLSQDEVISTLGDMKTSISDIETSVNNVKTSQADVKSSLNKLRTSQNGIENLLNKVSKNENFEANFIQIDEKLEKLEDKSKENGEKLEEIKQNLASTRHKISMNIQEAMSGIEKRLAKKFEDILDEKLSKILDEKFSKLNNVKLETK